MKEFNTSYILTADKVIVEQNAHIRQVYAWRLSRQVSRGAGE